MWKSRKDDEKPLVEPLSPQPAVAPAWEARPVQTSKSEEPRVEPARVPKTDVARIGRSVTIKGELSGAEDLFVDGEVEGSIELRTHALTVGPNGRVRANVVAQDVVIFGKVEGNVRGNERVELKRSAVLHGDIFTQRIVIEEGAFLKGGIDIQKPEPKPEVRRDTAVAASVAAPASSSAAAGSNSAAAPGVTQSSLLDGK
jgi:cytoskeletal protein CcmA (bactofilin family)